jgi:hypothetical protein
MGVAPASERAHHEPTGPPWDLALTKEGGHEMKIPFETPAVADLGSISAHTFMPTPPNPQGQGGGGHKGFMNCRVETTNCELSHPEDGGGGSP